MLTSEWQVYVSGDVTIDPSVAIGPGVIMIANTNSHLIIDAGVCIGMGTIIHAEAGLLEIASSVNLGTGVLIVGSGRIGTNVCIGSASTIINPDIPPKSVIISGSLIGDRSRTDVPSQEVPEPEILAEKQAIEPTQDPWQETEPELPKTPDSIESNAPLPETPAPEISEPILANSQLKSEPDQDINKEQNTTLESVANIQEKQTRIVYGREHINQLLSTLFPHRQR